MGSINKFNLESKEIDFIKSRLFDKLFTELDAFYYDEPVLHSTVWNFLSHYKGRPYFHLILKFFSSALKIAN